MGKSELHFKAYLKRSLQEHPLKRHLRYSIQPSIIFTSKADHYTAIFGLVFHQY
jgi:hypothetical protein